MKRFIGNVLAVAVLTGSTVAPVATGSAQNGTAAKPDLLRGVKEYNQATRYQRNHDSVEAAKWFLKSAELGFFQAKFEIGRMYYLGEGVPRDFVRAHMWFNLAGYGVYKKGVEEMMTPEQIAEAEELARNWKPK